MNGDERIRAALEGKPTDRVPVMLHNFLMAAREAGHSQRRFRESPAAIAGSFIRAVETYGYDGVLVDVDTVTVAEALGVRVDHPEDQPARWAGPRLDRLAEVKDLPPPAIDKHPRVRIWVEAVRRLVEFFGKEIYVRGNCDQAPFSLASMMRGPEAWMMDLVDGKNRAEAHALLAYCTEAALAFMRLMAGTGAGMVSNGDSPAGPDLISPAMYAEFAEPYERRLVEEAHALGLPYALHICGNTNKILTGMIGTGADALELDYKTDAQAACEALRGRAVFIGNIDPSGVLALGTPALVQAKTRELLEVFEDNSRFILNAGCAIPAETPPANLKAMIASARS
ncbi:MAG TPA: uroporphyrinogen decarboxylase family protein [Candidatus Bathyarchaeia archaeon]|nr:uroporphyrinogen decarboxylase family protein [Candidatus Bathyarchaeia archaeon]